MIDETIFKDNKDEGMQLFEKFKQLVIQLSEEEEQLAAAFKQANVVGSPP